jgi:DNA-binding CsgD family transcriptional regulator
MTDQVFGRERELVELRRLLRDPGMWPRALLIEGDAGAGKTTLWTYAWNEAASQGFTVLRCAPSEPEGSLAFSALVDLLGPHADVIEQLPEHQRGPLRIALAMEPWEQRPAHATAIAAATLALIRMLTTAGPLAIAIDDAQWLDPDSAVILGYVARRLAEGEVILLVSQRAAAGGQKPIQLDRIFGERLVRMGVEPLSVGATTRIVRERTGSVLPRQTMRRVHEASGGNPFFAVELARTIQRQVAEIAPGRPLPVPDTLKGVVSERLAALPLRVRRSLAQAAAVGQAMVSVLGDETALEEGVRAGIVNIERGRVRFVHPLLASAAYDSVDEGDRRAIHLHLACAVDDPEESARHLALASDGPDADVADTLDEASARAASRGAPGSAAELSTLARDMTPEHDRLGQARRAMDAGWYWFVAGDAERARGMLEDASSMSANGPTRAEALIRLGWLNHHAFDRQRAQDLYEGALVEAGEDVRLRALAHTRLAWGHLILRNDTWLAARHGREAVALCERLADPVLLVDALVTQAQSEFIMGGGLPSAPMERAMAIRPDRDDVRELSRPTNHRAIMLFWADRLDEARILFEEVLARAEERGDASAPPWPLMRFSHLELLAGNWNRALELAEAGVTAAIESGQRPLQADLECSRALVLAFLGRDEEAAAAAARGVHIAERTGTGMNRRLAAWALGLIDLAAGRSEAAYTRLAELRADCQATHSIDPGENRYVGDLGEAMVLTGRLDEAERLSQEVVALGDRLARPSAVALGLRVRALVQAARKEIQGAQESFDAALAAHDLTPIPFERARTLLAWGAAQRRDGHRRAARESLENAVAVFEHLGASAWSANARAELRRMGGRRPGSQELTSAERQVAELVAQGRSNRDVAAQLVVTVRTVESNLTRVYAKLGVRSRTELAHLLASTDAAPSG